MASTNFATGSIVTHQWLNEVNNVVWGTFGGASNGGTNGSGTVVLSSNATLTNPTISMDGNNLTLHKTNDLTKYIILGNINGLTGARFLYVQDATGYMALNEQLTPKSIAPNPFFQVDQLANNLTSVANDNYGHDHWILLTQTGNAQISTQYETETGVGTNARLTQQQAAAQRMGYLNILEYNETIKWRGRTLRFQPRIKVSVGTNIRLAVLEWTGTANQVTSNVVNSWTSTSYAAGNFFINTTMNVLGSDVGVMNNSWSDFPITINYTVGALANNLMFFIWTESAQAQNFTLDISKVRVVPYVPYGPAGLAASPDIYYPTFEEDLRYAQRFYEKSFVYGIAPQTAGGTSQGNYSLGSQMVGASTAMLVSVPYKTVKVQGNPVVTLYNPSAANGLVRNMTTAADSGAVTITANTVGFKAAFTSAGGTAAGNELGAYWTADSRL